MKNRPKQPFIPAERKDTIRHEIISALKGQTLSAREISASVRVSEKEAYEHLEHIRRTINQKEHNFEVTPAECRKCGFVFRKRERLKKPGKCPACHAESIQEPLFAII
ncbi:MAG: transcriptional regulator [Nitrospirae bacterium]|nr:transcriptional regulator [Nitrospirota bacterium]